jgi:hypothetical protein
LQVRAAREWPQAGGKVVVSEAEVRETRVIDSDREDGYRNEQRNYANIVYEYAVAGQKLRNNRVSIGETAAISGSRRRSRNIRSAPSSRSTTIRCIRTKRCWSATCRRSLGLSRHRNGGRARHRVRLGVRAQQTERIGLDTSPIPN